MHTERSWFFCSLTFNLNTHGLVVRVSAKDVCVCLKNTLILKEHTDAHSITHAHKTLKQGFTKDFFNGSKHITCH